MSAIKPTMDRLQRGGSLIGTVILIVLAALAYWQRDRILGMFSGLGGIGKEAPIALQISDMRCELSGSMGSAIQSAAVKNLSQEALTLSVEVVWHFEDLKPARLYGPVTPAPLPAGRSGSFTISRSATFGKQGTCKIQTFTNESTGKPVRFQGG